MASCPAQPRAHPGPLLLLQEWGWAHSDSTSPTSSPDAHRLSPSSASPASREPQPGRVPSLPPKQRSGRRAAGSGQRQSASEREKLRMRNLAKALHTLRCYLPPSVAPAGQSLTKIETLRLAIRYIAHLSERLGLSEQALAQRREPPRRCQLCPEGLGCCQARTPGRRATEPWVSPSYCPAAGTPLWPHGAPGTDTAAWLSAPPCPDAATPCRLVLTPSSRAASWVSATSCSDAGTPPELHGARLSDVLAWGSPTARPMAGSPPEPRGRQITDTAPWGSPLSCPDAPAAPEDSGTGALDARRRTWPTHGPLLAAFHQARPASPVLDWSVNPSPQPIGSLPEGPAAEPGWQREWWAAGTDHGMSSRTSAAVGHGDPGLFVEQI